MFGLLYLFYLFSRMHSEGFPFIVWGSGGWTLVRLPWLVAVALSSRRRRVVNSVSMGEAAKPLLFERFHAGRLVVLRGTRGIGTLVACDPILFPRLEP